MRKVPSKLNWEAGAGLSTIFGAGLRLSSQASKYEVVSSGRSANSPREESSARDSRLVCDSGAATSSPGSIRLLSAAMFIFQDAAIALKDGARLYTKRTGRDVAIDYRSRPYLDTFMTDDIAVDYAANHRHGHVDARVHLRRGVDNERTFL